MHLDGIFDFSVLFFTAKIVILAHLYNFSAQKILWDNFTFRKKRDSVTLQLILLCPDGG